MPINVGDVVSVPFFKNQENNGGTARIILVVEVFAGGYSVIPFTKQLHQSVHHAKCIEVKKDSEVGKKMGLNFDSILVVDRKMDIQILPPSPYVIGNCGEDFLNDNNL